ncbi:MAG: hypothetical protein K9G76_03760 [Bacteroidales bacterium]|nr:hypothetical protein [Bacteroidales bacterium]MCF8402911.1 hypothetical protein [Bacteroidales bacterium]
MNSELNIAIIGAGSIGTALGNVIARKRQNPVTMLSVEKDVVQSVNDSRSNFKYFPNIKLSKTLKATTDPAILQNAELIFLAIPSNVTVDYVLTQKPFIPDNAILYNMAKGFSNQLKTITETLSAKIPNPVCSFKGPTFARELIHKLPTGFTVGAENIKNYNVLEEIFEDTPVHLDYSNDVKGVELLSILKNIYAISMGIVDAQFNSPNLRFLFLTKAFNEMKNILLEYGGKADTMFRYCGYGDFSLTALNDLSRNRTLGLLIGKGFFTNDISDKLVLEGKIAVSAFCEQISKKKKLNGDYPIISELHKVFNEDYDVSSFVNKVI